MILPVYYVTNHSGAMDADVLRCILRRVAGGEHAASWSRVCKLFRELAFELTPELRHVRRVVDTRHIPACLPLVRTMYASRPRAVLEGIALSEGGLAHARDLTQHIDVHTLYLSHLDGDLTLLRELRGLRRVYVRNYSCDPTLWTTFSMPVELPVPATCDTLIFDAQMIGLCQTSSRPQPWVKVLQIQPCGYVAMPAAARPYDAAYWFPNLKVAVAATAETMYDLRGSDARAVAYGVGVFHAERLPPNVEMLVLPHCDWHCPLDAWYADVPFAERVRPTVHTVFVAHMETREFAENLFVDALKRELFPNLVAVYGRRAGDIAYRCAKNGECTMDPIRLMTAVHAPASLA